MSRSRRPGLESLESRDVPSAGGSLRALIHHPTAQAGRSGGHVVILVGQASGTASTRFAVPDVGKTTGLDGSGTVSPLGSVHVQGELHSTGFIAQGRAGGTLTLGNDRGSLSLNLTGPSQEGFSDLPSSFHYQITGATGAYAGDRGAGTVEVHLNPSRRPAVPPNASTTMYAPLPAFTLRFHR